MCLVGPASARPYSIVSSICVPLCSHLHTDPLIHFCRALDPPGSQPSTGAGMARARAAVAGHRPRQLHAHTARGAADHTRLAAGGCGSRGRSSGFYPLRLALCLPSRDFFLSFFQAFLFFLLHKLVQCSVSIVTGIIPFCSHSPAYLPPLPSDPSDLTPTFYASHPQRPSPSDDFQTLRLAGLTNRSIRLMP